MATKHSAYFLILFIAVVGFLFSSCTQVTEFRTATPELLEASWKVNGAPNAYRTVKFLRMQEFKIDRDGDGKIDILGYYQLRDGQMIFKDMGGIIVPACHREGVYRPQLRGDQLSFQLVHDECPGRLNAMKHVWQKASRNFCC